MKQSIFGALILGLAVLWTACNIAPDEEGDEKKGSATDVVYSWGNPGYRGAPGSSDTYPGIMVALSDAPTRTGTLGDISQYGQVIIDASLYASDDATTPLTYKDGLAWFKLLSGTDWNNAVSGQINNMVTNGEKSGSLNATVMPINLLVQTPANSGVKSIEIRSLTLKIKTDLPEFSVVYGATYVSTVSNTISFTNADYGNSAALYTFPQDILPVNGKTVKFTFKIESFDSGKNYQIHIQAANGLYDYDGRHPNDSNGNVGQFYVHLNENIAQTGEGSFQISGTSLQNATAFNSSSDSNSSGNNFPLTAIRIVNNGRNESTAGQMETSYRIAFNAITVE